MLLLLTMPKKVKNKNVKPIKDHNQIQINIKKDLEDDNKINPKKVFDGYTATKKPKKKKKY